MLRRRGKVAEDNVVSEESFPKQDHDDKHIGVLGKSNIHPEQSNVMLRNQKTTTFEVKDIEE